MARRFNGTFFSKGSGLSKGQERSYLGKLFRLGENTQIKDMTRTLPDGTRVKISTRGKFPRVKTIGVTEQPTTTPPVAGRPQIYVYADQDKKLWTSSDASAWTEALAVDTDLQLAYISHRNNGGLVVFGDELYIFGMHGSKPAYQVASGSLVFGDVQYIDAANGFVFSAWTDGTQILAGGQQGSTGKIWRYTGSGWSEVLSASFWFSGFAKNGSLIAALDNVFGNVYTSSDGTSWAFASTVATTALLKSAYQNIAAFNGQFVIAGKDGSGGSDGNVIFGTDAVSWTRYFDPATTALGDFDADGVGLTATALLFSGDFNGVEAELLRTTDGTTFTRIGATSAGWTLANCYFIGSANGVIVANVVGGVLLKTDDDGGNWVDVVAPGMNESGTAFCWWGD